MSRPLLYDYARSSACYRVRMALNLKGVDYESRPVDLLAGEQGSQSYLALNPLQLVPLLEIDGHRLTQSLAICDYLDARFPEPALVPSEPAARAHVLALALTVACEIHPINNLRVRQYLAGPLDASKGQVDEWVLKWIADGFEALESLAKASAGAFLYGDHPSLADICLVPQMYNARRFDVPLDTYPTLLRADENARKLDAFAAAHPDRQEQTA